MLAIAAPSFIAPSETFIHNHVRRIAPGTTILLCQDGTGANAFGCPVVADIDPWPLPRTVSERIVNAVRHRWRVYVDSTLRGEGRNRTLSFLKAHRPKVMLAEYGPMGCLLMGICREMHVPLYVYFHGYDASLLLHDRAQVRQYRRLFRSAAGIIVPSRYLGARLAAVGCKADKLHVCPNGVDPHRFRPTARKPGLVLAVGRLVEKKAPHLTIAAFGQIADRFPEARLDMIGEGPLRQRCEAVISEHGLGDRITLRGAQSSERVAELMQKASLFVQHSVTAKDGDTESFGVAIGEAMASAIPVVTTLHNGFPETVEEGVTGLLVPEGDVDGMAHAMEVVLADPHRAAAMGAAGRARVLERFTIEHTSHRLRAIMKLPPRDESQLGSAANRELCQ